MLKRNRGYIWHYVVMIVVGISLLISSAAYALKPLVIIRFNQKNVYYERPLFSAVSRAVKIKPDVRFDVIAISPVSSSPAITQKIAARTEQKATEVMQVLEGMGIPKSRIAYQLQYGSTLNNSEVHVFVK